MKMLSALIKCRLASFLEMFNHKGSTKKQTSKSGMIAIWVFVGISFLMMFFSVFSGMAMMYFEAGLDWLYFAMFGLLAFAIMFVGSVFMAQTQIFEATDNDLLLSMPIPARYVLLSRIVSVGVLNVIYEAVVAIPALACFFIWGSVTVLKVLFFLVLLIALPFLSLGLTTLFAWLLSALTSRMKRKTLFKMVLSIVLLGAYFVFCFNMSTFMQELVMNGDVVSEALGKVFIVYWVGSAVGNENALHLLFVVLISVGVFAAVYFALSRVFIKLATMNKGTAKLVYTEKKTKNKGADSALLRREFSRFVTSASYMMNQGLGLLFMVGLSVFAFVKRADGLAAVSSVFSGMIGTDADFSKYLAPLLGFALCFMNAMVLISAPSISMEGKNLWIAQSVPVDGSRVLIAKVRLHVLVSVPFIAVSEAFILIGFPTDILGIIATIAAPICSCIFIALIGVKLNMRWPKFDWIDELTVLKQGTIGIVMAIAFGIVLGSFILFSIVEVVALAVLGIFIHPAILLLVYAAVLFAISAAMYSGIKKNGGKKFAALGN